MSAGVITWLRSPEGEEWSRERHEGEPQEITVIRHDWTPGGLLRPQRDPCGGGPLKRPQATGSRP